MPRISTSLTTDPKTTDPKTNILCYHHNSSSQIQVIQFSNSNANDTSKIVFPGQRIMFEAQSDSQLEILFTIQDSAPLRQLLNCQDMQVNPQPESKLAI